MFIFFSKEKINERVIKTAFNFYKKKKKEHPDLTEEEVLVHTAYFYLCGACSLNNYEVSSIIAQLFLENKLTNLIDLMKAVENKGNSHNSLKDYVKYCAQVENLYKQEFK